MSHGFRWLGRQVRGAISAPTGRGAAWARVMLAVWLWGTGGMVLAQDGASAVAEAEAATAEAELVPNSGRAEAEQSRDTPQSFLEIVHAGGVVGYLTMALSVVAAAVAIDHLLNVRRGRLLPAELISATREQVKQGNYGKALALAQHSDSLLGRLLAAGLDDPTVDWPVMEKTLEDTLAAQAARLYRRIDYLALIGNLAPMLGLLGTVIGMVMAFREVATTQGAARAADLAEGIYLALVTTVQGLVVAIPALGVHALLRNRLDALLAEVASAVQQVLAPLRGKGSRPQPPRLGPGGV